MSFWSVARTLPQREKFAAERLGDGGFEVFLPLIHTKRASAPLFPGYLFVLIVDRWRSINSTLGVLSLVRVGDCPARCPDCEIDSLKAMIDGHGFVRLLNRPSKSPRRVFVKGAAVKIVGGPFQGVAALHSGLSAAEKEILLIAMLGASRRIAVPSHLVVPHWRNGSRRRSPTGATFIPRCPRRHVQPLRLRQRPSTTTRRTPGLPNVMTIRPTPGPSSGSFSRRCASVRGSARLHWRRLSAQACRPPKSG
jgi:transcriptional antiterminator RfaH